MIAIIFLEGGFGPNFIFYLFLIFGAIIFLLASILTGIIYIINQFRNIKQSKKYYVLIFIISILVLLIGTGIVCGIG